MNNPIATFIAVVFRAGNAIIELRNLTADTAQNIATRFSSITERTVVTEVMPDSVHDLIGRFITAVFCTFNAIVYHRRWTWLAIIFGVALLGAVTEQTVATLAIIGRMSHHALDLAAAV